MNSHILLVLCFLASSCSDGNHSINFITKQFAAPDVEDISSSIENIDLGLIFSNRPILAWTQQLPPEYESQYDITLQSSLHLSPKVLDKPEFSFDQDLENGDYQLTVTESGVDQLGQNRQLTYSLLFSVDTGLSSSTLASGSLVFYSSKPTFQLASLPFSDRYKTFAAIGSDKPFEIVGATFTIPSDLTPGKYQLTTFLMGVSGSKSRVLSYDFEIKQTQVISAAYNYSRMVTRNLDNRNILSESSLKITNSHHQVIGDTVFFIGEGLRSVKLDGTAEKLHFAQHGIESFYVDDLQNKVYFVDSALDLYTCELNCSNKQLLKTNPLPGASKSPAVEKFGDSIYWTVGVSGVGGSGFYRVDTNGDNFSSVFAVNIPYDLEIDTRDGSEALYVSEPWSGIRTGPPSGAFTSIIATDWLTEIAIDDVNNHLYALRSDAAFGYSSMKLYRYDLLTGNNPIDVTSQMPPLLNPESLEYSSLTDEFTWSDYNFGKFGIYKASLGAAESDRIVGNETSSIYSMVYHKGATYMGTSDGIYRQLLGEDLEKVVSASYALELSIDYNSNTMYWIDQSSKTINASNLLDLSAPPVVLYTAVDYPTIFEYVSSTEMFYWYENDGTFHSMRKDLSDHQSFAVAGLRDFTVDPAEGVFYGSKYASTWVKGKLDGSTIINFDASAVACGYSQGIVWDSLTSSIFASSCSGLVRMDDDGNVLESIDSNITSISKRIDLTPMIFLN